MPIIGIMVLLSRIVAPDAFTWDKLLEESGGIFGALFTGFIAAGLSEEFFRMVGQTRLAALFHSKGMGWFVTTLIWALMPTPKWYSDGHDLTEALIGSLRIIPLGLMWGYLTHRTMSLLPAWLVHGTNVWGLQNFWNNYRTSTISFVAYVPPERTTLRKRRYASRIMSSNYA